jgi:SsrA-binding protein
MAKKEQGRKVVAENRKARHEYFIEETFEAGIVLVGTEVKSLRLGKANINEAYASAENGDIWLINANIPEFTQANRFNHAPRQKRKLLFHRKQINKLSGAVQRDGMTLVPLQLYFNEKGFVKVCIGLAKGKQLHDKRETEKNRDWKRQQGRLMRNRG